MFGFVQSLRILALDAVLRPDGEAFWRHVCRWYSKTFHTPLHVVEDLPVDVVYQHYYEGIYEDLDAEELARVADDITETEESRRDRLIAEAKTLKVDTEVVQERLQAF